MYPSGNKSFTDYLKFELILYYFFSILLHTGEELGMKKDRLLLLDETIVPASMTQLREVHCNINWISKNITGQKELKSCLETKEFLFDDYNPQTQNIYRTNNLNGKNKPIKTWKVSRAGNCFTHGWLKESIFALGGNL